MDEAERLKRVDACHEAGHIAVGWEFGKSVIDSDYTLNGARCCLGLEEVEPIQFVAIAAAGGIAQEVIEGVSPINDQNTADDEGQIGDYLESLFPDDEDIRNKLWDDGYVLAESVVVKHKALISQAAEMMFQQGKLSSKDWYELAAPFA